MKAQNPDNGYIEYMDKPVKSIEQIFSDDGRYPIEAVEFVREGLSYTADKYHSSSVHTKEEAAIPRHVSGSQLCEGLRELAQKRWGLLARQVLKRWNITSTSDFGAIVFLLVNNGWMRKQPHDSIEDFDSIYDFVDAFDHSYEISLD